MKKIISKILILTLSIQLLMPYFGGSFAQEAPKCEANPPVCGATPETMALYLDFQREVAALIQTNPFKTANETVSEGEGGIFTNELLKLEELKNFDDSLAGQALKIFYTANVRSATALITSAFLFELAGLSTLADNSVGLTILFQDRPIVRDWAKLLDIERNLNQTAYHLGQAEEIARTITDTTPLKSILKKYEEAKLLKNADSFNSSIRYMDLLSALSTLNVQIKFFLAYGATKPLSNFQEQGLSLNPNWITKLKEEYRCVRWNGGFKCNRSRKSLGNSFKNLLSSTEKQGKGSLKQITQSLQELKSALQLLPAGMIANLKGQSSDAYLTEREKSLLRDVYGLDTTRLTKDKALSILSFNTQSKEHRRKLSKSIKTGWEKIIQPSAQAIASLGEKQTWKSLGKGASQAMKKLARLAIAPVHYSGKAIVWISSQFSRSPAEIQEIIKNENQIFFSQAELLNRQMINNLQQLTTSRLEAETLMANTENVVLTQQIGELSAIIKTLISTIGNKEKNLRKTLNILCVYQASNKGSAGCYIQ